MISLRDIHLTLDGPGGPVNILKGINLEIRSGETVSVVGPSGSGKTSMMMVIAGLENASSGTVEVDGVVLNKKSEDDLALFRRNRMGIVFQNFHLLPTMTALENVAMPAELAGVKDAVGRARSGLQAVGLGNRIQHYPRQLSGGEQQRVALARAFLINPKILLADEPTGNLDINTGKLVIDLLFKLSTQQQATLVLITHDPVIAKKCSRQIQIKDGSINRDCKK